MPLLKETGYTFYWIQACDVSIQLIASIKRDVAIRRKLRCLNCVSIQLIASIKRDKTLEQVGLALNFSFHSINCLY
ncbi:Chromosome (plasmid) partitioning protein ParB (plasmid) [Leptolyngbya boryana IAM M-101]|nr:Chromosome (plasmid) partitioning protein ParB [Leptolyngbya boryana IAM M-101]BAS66689.1 Chromosome (plasmid) partitioning protein ParB [Leptolyngbya boryana dg5]